MSSMTSAPRTYRASIASILHSTGTKTIVYPLGRNAPSCTLPLTNVEITLQGNEFFMATTALGEVKYLRDLNDALNWARSDAPDAVVILSPFEDRKEVSGLIAVSLHERATPWSL